MGQSMAPATYVAENCLVWTLGVWWLWVLWWLGATGMGCARWVWWVWVAGWGSIILEAKGRENRVGLLRGATGKEDNMTLLLRQ